MPDAPPRAKSESRPRDTSWKETNQPDLPAPPPRRNTVAVVAVLCLLALTGALVFRNEIQAALAKRTGADVSSDRAGPAGEVLLSLLTDISVPVYVNGELVGTTPVQRYPVKPGLVKLRYLDAVKGIDRAVDLQVPPGETFTHRENFPMVRVQFRAEPAVAADVLVRGTRIATTESAAISLAEGDYDFQARADNGALQGETHQHIGGSKVNFVDIKLRRR